MNDEQLFKAIRVPLLRLANDFGAPDGFNIERNYNLTQQGRETHPTVYMSRHTARPRGAPKDYTEWNTDTQQMDYFNKQTIEVTITFQAIIPAQCATGVRPGDVLDLISRVMQTSLFIEALKKSDVQILRIIDNQHSFVVNDRDEYEAVPLLQAVFVYTQTLKGTKSRINTRHLNITRV